jgi:hypothetical protein
MIALYTLTAGIAVVVVGMLVAVSKELLLSWNKGHHSFALIQGGIVLMGIGMVLGMITVLLIIYGS